MSTEENKTVVRRFITEVLGKGNLAVLDQLFAPNYINKTLGAGADAFKQFVPQLRSAVPDVQYSIENLVAEGDEVVARFTMKGTYTGSIMGSTPTGKPISFRGLTYYSFANGKIVEDDPITTPDMMQLLGVTLPPQKKM